MTDKEKIRAEIKRRIKLHKDSLTNPIHQGFGLQKVINAKISELTYLLSFIDSMQKEHVDYDKLNTMLDDALAKETKESWNKMLGEESKPKFKKGDYIRPIDSSLGAPRTILEVCDGWYVTNQGTLDFEYEVNWEAVEEPVSDDLEKEIEQYCIHHGYLDSFKDCGYTFNEQVGDIARHFANWQKQQDSKLPKIWPRDTIEEYAYQCAYDLSNDWAKETPEWNDVQNACILGAQWQKEKDMQKFLHSETATFTREEFDAEMEEVRKQTQKQMINKATKWLEENLAKETSAIVCGSANIDFKHAIEEFKKATED
jgi:hypothetical protein